MPATSKSQQRLFGMVHAYQKGQLRHPPKKVKEIAKRISEGDAEHFASTKHDGLEEKKATFDFWFDRLNVLNKMLTKQAAETPVVVYFKDKPVEFASIKKAAAFISYYSGIKASQVKEELGQRQRVIGGIRVEYPEVLPSKAEEETEESTQLNDLATAFKKLTGAYGASSYGV